MAMGVSLKRAIKAIGHGGATSTKDVARGMCMLGGHCADRAKRISRLRPTWPKRAFLAVHRPKVEGKRSAADHWLLAWDGEIFDPEGDWPNYKHWRITSYVEISE